MQNPTTEPPFSELLSFDLGVGPLVSEHERLLRTALRRGGAPEDHDPSIDLDAFEPSTIQVAQRVWRQRMVNEHHSSTVFSAMLPQMIACGAPLPFKTVLLRMAMDELRHGALCAQIVRSLGGDPTARVPLHTTPLPNHEGCSPLEVALRNSMFVGCLAETIAVAFTSAEREETEAPFVKAVITQISADEILHARFGWAFAKAAVPTLDTKARDRTSHWLRLAFAFLEREEMLEVPDVRPPSANLVHEGKQVGVCQNQQTRELFHDTISTVIIPGLENLGLAAADAWKHRSFDVNPAA